jgi:hypothetical protein
VGAVVAVEVDPAPVAGVLTVVAVDDGDAGAPVVAEDDDAAVDDDVVAPPAAWPAPPELTPAVFPPWEQAAGTASATTTPSTLRLRRVIEGHHRPRARCS